MANKPTCIIAPREICQTCGNSTGHTFLLTQFQHPSDSPLHRSQQQLTTAQRDSKIQQIGNLNAEIEQLDGEIERLEGTLRTLKAHRDGLKNHTKNEMCLLSPVRKLNDDVLGYIFVLSLDHLDEHVLKFERVCIHWRILAQSTPQLWSTVVLTRNSLTYWPIQNLCSYIYRRFRLSGQFPLTLDFGDLRDGDLKPEMLGEACVLAFARCAHRWSVVEFIPFELLRDISSQIPKGSAFDSLIYLSIARVGDSFVVPSAPRLAKLYLSGKEDEGAGTIISFQSIPSLRNLTIDNIKYPYEAFPGFPWDKVTSFTSEQNVIYREDELAVILQMMTHLTTLKVYGSAMICSPLVLPSVRFFSLERMTRYSFDMLQAFILPNLQTFHPNYHVTSDRIIGFLNRSKCTLEELKLSVNLGDNWSAQELTHVRKLTYSLLGTRQHVARLQWLNRRVGESEVLPNLEVLTLTRLRLTRDSEVERYIDIIESRLRKGTVETQTSDDSTIYLKEVTVEFEPGSS